jgi:hypothetical protein
LNHVAEQCKITTRSVFFAGEIGVNNYFLALMSKSLDVAESLVPHIIGTIRSALTVTTLLNLIATLSITKSR